MDKEEKAFAKKIKAANNSLRYLTKEKQSELGALAVQMEDNVFFCRGRVYKKTYMCRPAALGNKRTALIRALTDRFNNRMRFSLCIRNMAGKLHAYMFMTVTFEADTYYEAAGIIRGFEDSLKNDICAFLGISITPCTIESTLTYISMNLSGEMKKISPEALFKKEGMAEKLFLPVSDGENGFFKAGKQYGISFIGKNYADITDGVSRFLQQREGTYHIVVDFQGFNEDEQHVYGYEMKNRYSLNVDIKRNHLINMTYLLTFLNGDEQEVAALYDEAFRFYDAEGIQLMPGIGREKEIFMSECSLGLTDYHSMQNASPDIIGGLLF